MKIVLYKICTFQYQFPVQLQVPLSIVPKMASNDSLSSILWPFSLDLFYHLLQSSARYLLRPLLDIIMGNGSSKPTQIEHPKLVGKLPTAWDITKIDPELAIYSSSSSDPILTINSTHSPQEAVDLLKTHLAGVRRFVVVTHGFLSDKNAKWLKEMKEALLEDRKQIVAILGWGSGANIGLIQYPQAAANCLEVGRWLGSLLKHLRASEPTLPLYGIGHSLGGHLIGVAGRSSGQALDRITGLDPAGVGFQEANVEHRLAETDAKLVDVIHTDGQDVPYFGTLLPLGHIDFYPNYGWNQPNKDTSFILKPDQSTEVDQKSHRKKPLASQYGDSISESHSRAIEFFTWSIRNRRAFRTNLRLDGKPDVEKAVHRVVATGRGGSTAGTHEFTVEMGYYCDVDIEEQLAAEEGGDDKCPGGPRRALADFAGCYYVHTNATVPWC